MKLKITLDTLEKMLDLQFTANKKAFAEKILEHGLTCNYRTIVRHLEEDKISDLLTLPTVVSLCIKYKFAFAWCFTYYNMTGVEKYSARGLSRAKLHTEEEIHTDLLTLSLDICQMFPMLHMVKKKLGFSLDFLKLSEEDLGCLSDIPATDFIEAIMAQHLDMNKYIWQEGISMPCQHEAKHDIVSEEGTGVEHDNEYLKALLEDRLKARNDKKELNRRLNEILYEGKIMAKKGKSMDEFSLWILDKLSGLADCDFRNA